MEDARNAAASLPLMLAFIERALQLNAVFASLEQLRTQPMKKSWLAAVLLMACSTCGQLEAPPPNPAPPPAARKQWYPLALPGAGVHIPSGCFGKCNLDCDVWYGLIQCERGGGPVEVWGGTLFMAGMELDHPRAQIEGRASLAEAAELRWGTSKDGDFCVTVVRENWNWQFCTPDLPDRREFALALGRSYADAIPADELIQCENNGC